MTYSHRSPNSGNNAWPGDKVTKGDHVYHEPPYTEEEEADFYRRVGDGPVSILHASKQPKPKDDEKDVDR
jgi:hypothetical protein